MLGVSDVADELLTVAGVGPQVLRLPVLVAHDDGVGSTQDRLRRAVVLLEQDHSGARKSDSKSLMLRIVAPRKA